MCLDTILPTNIWACRHPAVSPTVKKLIAASLPSFGESGAPMTDLKAVKLATIYVQNIPVKI